MAAPDDLEEIELQPLGEGDSEIDPNGESPVLSRLAGYTISAVSPAQGYPTIESSSF